MMTKDVCKDESYGFYAEDTDEAVLATATLRKRREEETEKPDDYLIKGFRIVKS